MGKLKKEKHNHKLTDFLKVGIFSLVMLAPFISIGSKMAYVTFNKNAKDSYSGNTELTYYDKKEYPTNEINNNGDLIEGNYYRLYLMNLNDNSTWADVSTSDISEDLVIYGYSLPSDATSLVSIESIIMFNYDYNYIMGYVDLPSNSIDLYYCSDNDNFFVLSLTYDNSFDNGYIVIQYNLNISVAFDTIIEYQFFAPIEEGDIAFNEYEEKTLTQSTLDNVFEYAVNQLGETQIFAWTKNTAIYTPIETMTNGLGFDPNNNTLAILLTYWSLVTAVYVIMDIILFAFTKITHFTQD